MSYESSGPEEWPVQVFRYTSSGGWETVGNADDVYSDTALMATPNVGHIAIPRLKARILVAQKDNEPNRGGLLVGGSHGCVIRRLDTLYVPLHTGGAIVLKFRSKEESVEFSDRFTTLNPRQADMSDGETSGAVQSRHVDAVSYVVRLLHDKDFMRFVDGLEETLKDSEDGASIVAALQHRGGSTTGTQNE